MTHYSRAQIGLRPRRARYRLVERQVEGIALHWPAITSPLANPARVMSALRAWQMYHMDQKGWSDIAYQVAVDQMGNTYQLRGLRYRSGANGDQDVNERFGALLLVVAAGEKPTLQLIETVQGLVARHQELFPRSTRIVGHGEIRPEPTACPGPRIQALIEGGNFDPSGGTR